MKIAPVSISGPATRDFSPLSWLKRFSDGVIWMCRVNVDLELDPC